MLFRPEEVHGASGKRDVFKPVSVRHGNIGDRRTGINFFEFAVTDLDTNRFPAIQAGRVNPHGLAGEKPANCQRFKGSLTEPLLLAINSNTVLGGKVVEGGK